MHLACHQAADDVIRLETAPTARIAARHRHRRYSSPRRRSTSGLLSRPPAQRKRLRRRPGAKSRGDRRQRRASPTLAKGPLAPLPSRRRGSCRTPGSHRRSKSALGLARSCWRGRPATARAGIPASEDHPDPGGRRPPGSRAASWSAIVGLRPRMPASSRSTVTMRGAVHIATAPPRGSRLRPPSLLQLRDQTRPLGCVPRRRQLGPTGLHSPPARAPHLIPVLSGPHLRTLGALTAPYERLIATSRHPHESLFDRPGLLPNDATRHRMDWPPPHSVAPGNPRRSWCHDTTRHPEPRRPL